MTYLAPPTRVPFPAPPAHSAPLRRRDHPDSAALRTAHSIVAHLREIPCEVRLTPREAELLPWLATDLGYATIAAELGYGQDNARLLAKRLLLKLGVRTRAAAIGRWLRPSAFDGTIPMRVD